MQSCHKSGQIPLSGPKCQANECEIYSVGNKEPTLLLELSISYPLTHEKFSRKKGDWIEVFPLSAGSP